MTFHQPTADSFLPLGGTLDTALQGATHLGIGAHQDDLELIALPGILDCFRRREGGFVGVTCTHGAGSPRRGIYGDYSDAEMRAVRRQEQRTAATIGRYRAMIQLDYASAEVKTAATPHVADDLFRILDATRPEVVYTHNPADKHDTHVGVMAHALTALRRLAPTYRPKAVYGCEVWRGLDWLPDAGKRVLETDAHENLAAALMGVFDSQIAGGKRYDLAASGRRRANATYLDSHKVDASQSAVYAMDLMPLVEDPGLSIAAYTAGLIDSFRTDVLDKLARWAG